MRRTSVKGPEEVVVQEHVRNYKDAGFFINIYESKAIRVRGYYAATNLAVGTPDLLGVCPRGYFHACEVKAVGSRGTAREAQLDFLLEVISRGGFAVVSDSWDYTLKTYECWLMLDTTSRRHYLLDELPRLAKKRPLYASLDGRQAEWDLCDR